MTDEKPDAPREPSKRLFVGARVSIPTANAIAAAAQTLARRARDAQIDLKWVRPESYHVTLKFLGQTREAAVGAIVDAIAAVCAGTPLIRFQTARVGGFPAVDKARVIWAGIEDGGALGQLADKIDRACAALGFVAESRSFHAHVTLARVRETRPLKEVVLPMAEQMFGDTRLDAISLFESKTDSKGSAYFELSRIPFKVTETGPETAPERQSRAVELGAPSREPVEIDTDDGWPRGQGPAET